MAKQDLVAEMQKVAAKAQAGDEQWLISTLGLLAQLVRVGGPLSAIRMEDERFQRAVEAGGEGEKLFEALAAEADETFVMAAVDAMMAFAAAGAQQEDERHAALLGALMMRASVGPGGARLTPVLGIVLQAQLEEVYGAQAGPDPDLDVEAAKQRIGKMAPDLLERLGKDSASAIDQAVALATAAFREAPSPPSIFTSDELLLLVTSCEDSFKKLEAATQETTKAALAEVSLALESVLDEAMIREIHSRLAAAAADAGDDEELRVIGTALWVAFLADPGRVAMLALLRGQFSPFWRDEAEVKILEPVFARFPWVESDLIPYHEHLTAIGETEAAAHLAKTREILRARAASRFGI